MYYCLCRLQRMHEKKNHKEITPKKTRWRATHGVTSSFRHPLAPTWSPSEAAGGSLLFHGLQGHSCITMTHATGGISALTSETLLYFLLHQPWCLQSCSSHVFPLLSLSEAVVERSIPPFWICYPGGATITTGGLSLGLRLVFLGANWLCLHQVQGKPPAVPHRSHPKTLPCKPNTFSCSKQTRSQSPCQPCVKDIMFPSTQHRETVRIDGFHPFFS